ncbi:nuclear polyadenylated RNA-binding protein 4 isoform X2 [Nematostella vectensis]|uniref:nuclear polyadenylated RNA-binding protein 4 isoform X2 n=1 Tax=Nematostella vectensis TaxID=45351 RepID=UPI002076E5DE|nr:nuclear polyadenylated RNA-binding protein 4 isoform X2 [Nematostella vectensis]
MGSGFKMATFGWSYKSNVSGAKPPKEQLRKLEEWQKERPVSGVPLHRQTHSTESIYAGMKRKRYNPRSKVFVGNLNRDTKPVTLAEYFSVFGEIEGLRIIKDHETGISRGFAFITFTEPESASKAIRWCKHHHPQLDGRQITISGAERRRKAEIPRSNKSRRTGQTLYWEYKWHDKPDAEVFGPYETSLMLEWSNAVSTICWYIPEQMDFLTSDAGFDKLILTSRSTRNTRQIPSHLRKMPKLCRQSPPSRLQSAKVL